MEVICNSILDRLFFAVPIEMVIHIMKYDGRVKYRNGIWMYQIDSDNPRYTLLNKIPKFYKNLCIVDTQWESVARLSRVKTFIVHQKKFDPADETVWDSKEYTQTTNYLSKTSHAGSHQPIIYKYCYFETIVRNENSISYSAYNTHEYIRY
jgi:hypothetical protein